jgi:hypothetical protein
MWECALKAKAIVTIKGNAKINMDTLDGCPFIARLFQPLYVRKESTCPMRPQLRALANGPGIIKSRDNTASILSIILKDYSAQKVSFLLAVLLLLIRPLRRPSFSLFNHSADCIVFKVRGIAVLLEDALNQYPDFGAGIFALLPINRDVFHDVLHQVMGDQS